MEKLRAPCTKLATRFSQIWSRLQKEYPELTERTVKVGFGPGRPTDCADTATLVEIAWLCPGKAAKEFRRQGAVTLCRALGGDLTLVDEIERRHVQVAGTETERLLLGDGGQALVGQKRAREEHEQVLGLLERKVALTERILAICREAGTLDAATLQAASDCSKNTLLMLSDGGEPGAKASSPVTWSVLMRAQALGVKVSRKDWADLGKAVTKAYRRRYGCDPKCGKKPGINGDTGVPVWHYTEAECEECVDDAIRGFGK